MPDSQARSRRKRDGLIIGMGLLCLLSAAICVAFSATTLSNRTALIDQKQGRGISLAVTCGAVSAVIDAGRKVIIESSPPPPSKEAEDAAVRYGRRIAAGVQRQSGRSDLVNRDGSLRCDRLAKAAHTAAP